jgi:diguanylate cyclase (GGDEF)-like protein
VPAAPPRQRCPGAALALALALALLAWWLPGAAWAEMPLPGAAWAAMPLPVAADPLRPADLMRDGRLYQAGEGEPPADAQHLEAWLAGLRPVARVDLRGGRYWLHALVHNPSTVSQWVVDPHASLVERIRVRVLVPGQPAQDFDSGYLATDPQYPLHYGGGVSVPPGAVAHVLVRMESPYFARFPRVSLVAESAYHHAVLSETVLALTALGAIGTLALYNLFLFFGTRDRALLYYSLYMLCAVVAWGLTFHLGAQWLRWHDLRWHYVGFFLFPVFNGLFFIEFLQLQRVSPWLTRATRFNIVLSLALLPSCFLALPWAHSMATLVISMSVVLALAAGWVSLAAGFAPARYFLAAFLGLALPASIILPANVGLIDTPVSNPELLTLLGSAVDAVLLALALADKIRLLARQKDEVLQRLDHALEQTRTDHLTGIPNRHAFDTLLEQAMAPERHYEEVHRVLLVMIDLDGLKRINDRDGHIQGDALLREFARLLRTLCDARTTVFRLGGDEFAVLSEVDSEARLRAALPALEARLRTAGFPDSGVSCGMAYGSETRSAGQLISRADSRMYEHKLGKREPRDAGAGAAPALSRPARAEAG